MKKILKLLLWLLGILALLLLIIAIAFQVSPYPGAFVINHIFAGDAVVTDESRFAVAQKDVALLSNIRYDSRYQKNSLDIYYPKDQNAALPIVFWIHGGGYVGGDKSGSAEFATYLAHYEQVAVVAVNYELAPKLRYPGQLEQVSEMYQFLSQAASDYPMLDFSRIFFGGDSAGAQIAAQFTALQTNPAYAQEMALPQSVAPTAIKGFISYCGPLDLQQTAQQSTDDRFMKFFVKTVAWSLLGKKDWQNTPELKQASVANYLTAAFPASYLTDGNRYSFQEQGLTFAAKLQALNVPVETRFYKDATQEVLHEYQFDYTTAESQKCLEETLAFIHKQLH